MHGSRPLSIVLIGLMLFNLGCSTVTPPSGSQDTPVNEMPANLPEKAPKNSAQALENVARITYEALAAGEDLSPYIIGVMTAFGVPPLGDDELKLVEKRYSQGLPLMFMPQVFELADAFNDGGYVSLDSFIAGANDQGAKQQGTDEPLTREYLTQKFGAYTGKTEYAPGQVLPAFVLALGKERASRFPPENPDPLWGDDLLDPLQLTLLLYSVSYADAPPVTSSVPTTAGVVPGPMEAGFTKGRGQSARMPQIGKPNPITEFILDQLVDDVTGDIQDLVGVPLDELSAMQVSLCASLLLYGHKLKVTTTPSLIYHKQESDKPWSTRVEALLTFQDDYWNEHATVHKWLLNNLVDCELPPRGPVAGKPLEWSVSRGLRGHGDFNIAPPQTNDSGQAYANWQAVKETTPKSQRTFQNQWEAVGAVIVRASGLLPGWSGLERIVGVLKDTGNTGDSPLTVIYYTGEAYEAVGQEGLLSYVGPICDLAKPFTLNANVAPYLFTVEFTPSGKEAGAFTINGTIDIGTSITSITGEGTYTVERVDGKATQLVLTVTNATSFNPLVGEGHDVDIPLNINLVPLDPEQCG